MVRGEMERCNTLTLNPGQYIGCMYDESWWLANIEIRSQTDVDEVKVKFMHPHGLAASFSCPNREDVC